jgi:hypothetical protein
LQALCADVERLGRAGHLAPLPPLVDRLEIEYNLVAARLAELSAEAKVALQAIG